MQLRNLDKNDLGKDDSIFDFCFFNAAFKKKHKY